MKRSETLAAIEYFEATFHCKIEEESSEEALWFQHMANVDPEDVKAAIDDLGCETTYRLPTVQRIAAVADEYRRERLQALEQPALTGEIPSLLEEFPAVHDLVEPIGKPVPMTEAERLEWGADKPPREVLNLQMCGGVGKRAVRIEGVLCCPDCSSPIADGCRTRAEA